MGRVVIGISSTLIDKYSAIDFAFDSRFFVVNLTIFGLPVLPEVGNNNARSLH